MALQPAPFREEAVIHGALPKVHMLLSPYLLPIDRRPRLFTLRVPFICLPVFRLALSRCERSQELEPRGQARGLLKGSMGEGDARC